MNTFEIANKLAQRLLYGHIHHYQLSNFFKMLDLPYWADELKEASIDDAMKRQKVDCYIIEHLRKFPAYSIPQVDVINAEFKQSPKEAIMQNEKIWLKRGIDEYCKYEQETLNMLENLHKEATNANDNKLADMIAKFIDGVKQELDTIKSEKLELEKHGFDFNKFNKGEFSKMPRDYREYRDDDYDDEYRARGGRGRSGGRSYRDGGSEYRDGGMDMESREYRDGHHDGWHEAHEMMRDYPSYDEVEMRRRGRSSRTGRYTRR